MSDLEKFDDSHKSIEEIAYFQPKDASDNNRSLTPMRKSEWIEILEWLTFRYPDTANWSDIQRNVYYSDLCMYTKADVFHAVRSLYEEGRAKAPEGSIILGRLKSLNAPKLRVPSPTEIISSHGGKCDQDGYVCQFSDRRWASDEYGNWHFKEACMSNGASGYCEKLRPATPDETELRQKPTRSNKGELYRTMHSMKTLNEDMKRQVWKTYEKYPDGDIEQAIKELGKASWYE